MQAQVLNINIFKTLIKVFVKYNEYLVISHKLTSLKYQLKKPVTHYPRPLFLAHTVKETKYANK